MPFLEWATEWDLSLSLACALAPFSVALPLKWVLFKKFVEYRDGIALKSLYMQYPAHSKSSGLSEWERNSKYRLLDGLCVDYKQHFFKHLPEISLSLARFKCRSVILSRVGGWNLRLWVPFWFWDLCIYTTSTFLSLRKNKLVFTLEVIVSDCSRLFLLVAWQKGGLLEGKQVECSKPEPSAGWWLPNAGSVVTLQCAESQARPTLASILLWHRRIWGWKQTGILLFSAEIYSNQQIH